MVRRVNRINDFVSADFEVRRFPVRPPHSRHEGDAVNLVTEVRAENMATPDDRALDASHPGLRTKKLFRQSRKALAGCLEPFGILTAVSRSHLNDDRGLIATLGFVEHDAKGTVGRNGS